MSWWQLANELESALSIALNKFTQDQWKEVAIVVSALQAMSDALAQASFEEPQANVSVAAKCFVLDGPIEEQYGDIAVVVGVTYRDGHTLEGVAFYEAKKRDWDTAKISAFKRRQLLSMHSNLYHAHLLVFDRDRQPCRNADVLHSRWWDPFPFGRSATETRLTATTHVLAIPAGPALSEKKADQRLYKFGLPWASQVVLRNMQGFDLEHEAEVVDAAKGYGERMRAKYVLAVGIAHGGSDPAGTPTVNAQRLAPLNSGRAD